MKAKKALAIASSVAALAFSAIGMAGCGGDEGGSDTGLTHINGDITPYVTEYQAEPTGVKEFKRLGEYSSVSKVGNCYAALNNGLYTLLSPTGEYITGGATSSPNVTADSYGLFDFIRVSNTTGSYDYYDYDGRRLLTGASSIVYAELENRYLSDDDESTLVLTISDSSSEPVEAYYKVDLLSLEIGDRIDDKGRAEAGSEVGDNKLGMGTTPIYRKSVSAPVTSGEIMHYTYSYLQNEYRFYRDGHESGRVDFANAELLCFVGDYMYYSTKIDCGTSAGAGNIVYPGSSNYNDRYYDYHLYRYNIVSNSNQELNCNIVVEEMDPLYNKDAKTIDAVLFEYYELHNGVVTKNSHTAIANSNLEVMLDFGEDMNLNGNPYILNDRIVCPITVTDSYDDYENLTVIADMNMNPTAVFESSSTLYPDVSLISFVENGKVGFTDLDGKVVIEPKYLSSSGYTSGIKFYDGHACVTNAETGKKVFLKADGTETPITQNASVVTGYSFGWYYEKNSSTSTITLKSFDGEVTQTVNNATDIYDDGPNMFYVTNHSRKEYYLILRG